MDIMLFSVKQKILLKCILTKMRFEHILGRTQLGTTQNLERFYNISVNQKSFRQINEQ